MDEVEGHRGRRPAEIVKPVNESGERSYADDTERRFRNGGHRLDATPGETEEQERFDYLRPMPVPILVEACVSHLTGAVTHQSGMTFRAPQVTIGDSAARAGSHIVEG